MGARPQYPRSAATRAHYARYHAAFGGHGAESPHRRGATGRRNHAPASSRGCRLRANQSGVQAPAPELSLPDETTADAPVPAPAERRPFALLIAEDRDVVTVVGQGVTLDFASTERVESDSVEELLVEAGRIVPGRVINGDERLSVLPTHRVGGARVRLLRRGGTG